MMFNSNNLIFKVCLGFVLFFSFFRSIISLKLEDNTDDNDANEEESAVILLFMFFGIMLGVIVSQFVSKYGEAIPYTVIVFLLGVLFSLANGKNG